MLNTSRREEVNTPGLIGTIVNAHAIEGTGKSAA